MQIKILDAVECEISKQDAALLKPCLSFDAYYWKQTPYKKKKMKYSKDVFSFRGQKVWRFYTGLLPRIKEWCKQKDIDLEIVGDEFYLEQQVEPFLKGITFRDDQLAMIKAACKQQRGIVHAATGVGKTIIMLGIISCFKGYHVLILAHTIDITSQIYGKLKDFGFTNIELFGDG